MSTFKRVFVIKIISKGAGEIIQALWGVVKAVQVTIGGIFLLSVDFHLYVVTRFLLFKSLIVDLQM